MILSFPCSNTMITKELCDLKYIPYQTIDPMRKYIFLSDL